MQRRILILLLLAATSAGCLSRNAVDPGGPAPRECPVFHDASTGLPNSGQWRTHPSIGDVNGDGLQDIAGVARKAQGPRVFVGDGLGNWTESSEGLSYHGGFSCGVGTRLADLDRDGDLDLAIADHCMGVHVYHGDGNGSWTEASRGIPQNVEGFNDVDVGDLDGDGWPDLVAVSAFTRGLMVLRGRPNSVWEWIRDTGLPKTGSGWQVQLVDVDEDGRMDILSSFNPVTGNARDEPPPPTKVWLQREPWRFSPAEGFHRDGRYFGVAAVRRAQQAVPDLLLTVFGNHAGLYLWESESGSTWTSRGRLDESWVGEQGTVGFNGIRVADFDGDGCGDLVAAEAGTGRLYLALGDCRGGWFRCPEDVFVADERKIYNWGLAVGDLNGDGLLDLVSSSEAGAGGLTAWIQADRDGSRTAQGQGPAVSRVARAAEPLPAP